MTTRSFYTGQGSVCKEVIHELKPFISEYEKASDTLFDITKDRLDDAIRHAKRVLKHCNTVQTDDPSTRVHELVLYLKQLKA